MFIEAERAVELVRDGGRVILVGGGEDGAHGDVIVAAEWADADAINFMARHARGIVSIGLTEQRCEQLGLRPLAEPGAGPRTPLFTESIEARVGVSTGISAHDRARTVAVAVDPEAGEADICCPGHMFPLQGRGGGVLERPEAAEAGIDLARLAGLRPAAVYCAILAEDGSVAGLPELTEFCRRHGLAMLAVEDLIDHRRRHERLVRPLAEPSLPVRLGGVRALAYTERFCDRRHLALVSGDPASCPEPAPVHIHRRPPAADAAATDPRLELAIAEIEERGCGAIAYLDVEAEPGAIAADAAPLRPVDVAVGLQIFADLGLTKVRPLCGAEFGRIAAELGLELAACPVGA